MNLSGTPTVLPGSVGDGKNVKNVASLVESSLPCKILIIMRKKCFWPTSIDKILDHLHFILYHAKPNQIMP